MSRTDGQRSRPIDRRPLYERLVAWGIDLYHQPLPHDAAADRFEALDNQFYYGLYQPLEEKLSWQI